MAGAFQLLRSNDLIWSHLITEYFLGQADHGNDLMAWNADATRMPYRMHSEYLRHLFLDNDLSKGRFQVDGRPIALTDIRIPMCVVGALKDHIAPWRSVFRIGLLADTEITFILTAGGHNAGIVSEPGHPHRSFQMSTHHDIERYVDPDRWAHLTPRRDGSWWPAWADWLAERSSGECPARALGAPDAGYPPAADAPGDYVLMR
jgi:polyhydroxyalkanoate synthase